MLSSQSLVVAPRPLLVFSSCFVSLFSPFVRADLVGTFSLPAQPAYSSLRVCAQNCINFGLDGGYLNDNTPDLAVFLNCGGPFNIENACICRSDLISSGSSYLTSCASKECTNSIDASSAAALYVSYCSVLTPAATTTAAGAGSSTAGS
jgi:hypothetical protein